MRFNFIIFYMLNKKDKKIDILIYDLNTFLLDNRNNY